MLSKETTSPPADILITGHFHVKDDYATYRSRGSQNWLITYTLSGRGLYRQPDLQLWAEPGDLVILRPGAIHDYSVPPDHQWEFIWAHFQPRLSWLTWWSLPESAQGLYHVHLHNPQTRERVQQTFFQIHQDATLTPPLQTHFHPSANKDLENTTQPLQRELALNGLETILLLTARDGVHSYRSRDPRVQHVLELITEDLTKPHSLTSLARSVSLSPTRLAHLFKDEVGNSVGNVILTLRLQTAARLLEHSPQTISKIATLVGFNSAYYFSRQFHQRFGMSPRLYRQTVINNHSLKLDPSLPS